MIDLAKAKMQLPKKIDPDNIRESVVEVKYISKLPFEILLGIAFKEWAGTFTYTSRPIQSSSLPQGIFTSHGQELTIRVGNTNLFYNDKISVQLSPNTLVFTCLEHYMGWDVYEPEIRQVLTVLEKTKEIIKWTRVGIRYISEYPDRNLNECFKFNFSFGLPEIQSDTTFFRTEFGYRESKVILSLNNKVNVIKQDINNKQLQVIPTSIVDIDVISDSLEITNLAELLNLINENHKKEKELFFGMIKDDFLTTLNPEY